MATPEQPEERILLAQNEAGVFAAVHEACALARHTRKVIVFGTLQLSRRAICALCDRTILPDNEQLSEAETLTLKDIAQELEAEELSSYPE